MRPLRFRMVVLAWLLTGCDAAQSPEAPTSIVKVAAGCDIRQGCEVDDERFAARLLFAAPPRALKSFPVRLYETRDPSAETITVTFSMQGMDMGLNRYSMLADGGGAWSADVTLPVCMSGRSDWIAEFELTTADRRVRIPVPFVLEK